MRPRTRQCGISARRCSIAASPRIGRSRFSPATTRITPAGARRAARRRAVRADLARLFVGVARVRRAQARDRRALARAGLRRRESPVRSRHRRRTARRGSATSRSSPPPTSIALRRCPRAPTSIAATRRSCQTTWPRFSSRRDRPGTPKGVDQHASHALQQSADDPADAAVSRRRAAGARRLAAVASHLRRQSQHRHRRLQRRLAAHRRGPAAAGPVRRDRCATSRDRADGVSQRARRATRSWCGRCAADPGFAAHFFSRVRVLFYAAASLSQHVSDELQALAVEACGERLVLVTGLGSTETAPMAICRPWPSDLRVGDRPAGARRRGEARAVRREARAARARPERHAGLLAAGRADARPRSTTKATTAWATRCVRPIQRDLSKGLLFDGRIKEDFKLSTGTWVSVGPLRARIVAALRAVPARRRDHRRGPRRGRHARRARRRRLPRAVRAISPPRAGGATCSRHPAVRSRLQALLDAFASQRTGSSNRVDPGAGARGAAVARRRRDHRQGLAESARDAARRAPLVDALCTPDPPPARHRERGQERLRMNLARTDRHRRPRPPRARRRGHRSRPGGDEVLRQEPGRARRRGAGRVLPLAATSACIVFTVDERLTGTAASHQRRDPGVRGEERRHRAAVRQRRPDARGAGGRRGAAAARHRRGARPEAAPADAAVLSQRSPRLSALRAVRRREAARALPHRPQRHRHRHAGRRRHPA